jgi:hypothetical protein
MNFNRHSHLLKLLFVVFFEIQAHALEQKLPDNTRPYLLPEQANLFSIEQESTGDLGFANNQLEMSNSKEQVKLHHLRHSRLNHETYLIWKFVPVGLGYLFSQNETEQVSAEWEMKYQADEPLLLSPHFSGKKKSFWSPRFGSQFEVDYSYHYFSNPTPSYWDAVLKYSLIFLPTEKWRIGLFLQPEKFLRGPLSVPESRNPFPYEQVFSTGFWTEFDLARNLFLSSQGSVHFMAERADTFKTAYGVNSMIGIYF